MTPNIELLVVLALVAILLVVLRINAALVFLSLCLGQVLVTLVAQDADSFIRFISPEAESLSTSSLELAMLLTPAVLTSVIMLFSVHGRLRVTINVLPALGVAALAILLAIPLFTPGLRATIEAQAVWQQLEQAQALIVSVTALISLTFLWSQRRHAKKQDHRK